MLAAWSVLPGAKPAMLISSISSPAVVPLSCVVLCRVFRAVTLVKYFKKKRRARTLHGEHPRLRGEGLHEVLVVGRGRGGAQGPEALDAGQIDGGLCFLLLCVGGGGEGLCVCDGWMDKSMAASGWGWVWVWVGRASMAAWGCVLCVGEMVGWMDSLKENTPTYIDAPEKKKSRPACMRTYLLSDADAVADNAEGAVLVGAGARHQLGRALFDVFLVVWGLVGGGLGREGRASQSIT